MRGDALPVGLRRRRLILRVSCNVGFAALACTVAFHRRWVLHRITFGTRPARTQSSHSPIGLIERQQSARPPNKWPLLGYAYKTHRYNVATNTGARGPEEPVRPDHYRRISQTKPEGGPSQCRIMLASVTTGSKSVSVCERSRSVRHREPYRCATAHALIATQRGRLQARIHRP